MRQRFSNPRIAGSIPAGPTNSIGLILLVNWQVQNSHCWPLRGRYLCISLREFPSLAPGLTGLTRNLRTRRTLPAALSTFYDDEQNASICWQQAMMLAAEDLAGFKPSEEELTTARKKGVEEGCR